VHGWVGLALVAIVWPLNWSLPGLRTHWCFFPLWLGYCLTVDALVYRRTGTSLVTRSPARYAGLFVASVPGWWLFELINARTQNWHYEGTQVFSGLEYFLLASLSFSTVMPAVFGTAELASSFGWIRRLGPGPRLGPTRRATLGFFVAGWAMLALLLVWPRYCFAFVWLSVYFIIAPVNIWLRTRSLADATDRRDWRPVLSLWVGCLICAFFWEMWNFLSYPKWIYRVPFVGFWHVFEMPILGYTGYLPFALELFALYHLVLRLVGADGAQDYVRLAPPGGRPMADEFRPPPGSDPTRR
jgi:hypothetical protein